MKRLSRIVPVAVLLGVAAFGFVGVGAGAPAQASETTESNTPTQSKNFIDSNDSVGGSVGSGRENYSQPNGEGLPDGENPGKTLYENGCSTCHGLKGESAIKGVPPLIGVGEAAVDFYVGSGRMPLSTIQKQAPRNKPIYTQEQIDAIGKYVAATFGGGPEVPEVNLEEGDLVEGNQLYASNCAQCHNSAGSGGSLGLDYNAPRVFEATPTQIAEAIRVGPGPMPQFGPDTFSEQQVDSIVKYVDELGTSHPGGLKLGATGPVPEGYFAWFVGIGGCLLFARWIGTRV